ncbi:anthranilate synthase alpha subunit 2, chloroplastic isoform X2 [Selaginella moellendorffii]|uniref:anthranilate synthase alpha subunit 2, chloroplastic isoform X2 n=1 Tax=Selaginella moellendorffii TaxID=88036 RepID=UPI000D1CA8C8|nr:anthranilate synthase alpha subunit 2, chloroplastic isoform X2 [Selaginella moellendorffii]|eukprot:XP_024535097.1 anthranilate synthase alpha subunit 2, chloroplastic isoform X2 [Selaginella moellendorffii]
MAACGAFEFQAIVDLPRRRIHRQRQLTKWRSGSAVRASSQAQAQFHEACKRGNLVPLFQRIFSDHLTPVLAYRCLVKEDDREAPSFLFESVEHTNGVSNVGRYSMVGAQPAMEIVAKENMLTIISHEDGYENERIVDDPMKEPEEITSDWSPVPVDGLPNVFCGGWVGYFSYDTVRYSEKKKIPFASAPLDDRGLPDMHLGLYKDVIVFDHVTKIAYAVHWVDIRRYEDPNTAFQDGKKRLQELIDRVQNTEVPRLSHGNVNLSVGHYGNRVNKSNMSLDQFKGAVLAAKEHILAGDIFQIVLSQRFERRTAADPFEARGSILVASSPEILTRIKHGKVINRPLAGTRRRGVSDEEDKKLEESLLKDEKECAEHVMLVDLGRNDVGKVSKAGSVQVEKFMEVERYSHVMHISSTVTGELQEGLSSWDALRAALPVGTVSGAPKVRAMQLIDELELTRRGPYSGGIGSISFNGDMDVALALRTMVFPTRSQDKNGSWLAHLQAGAGVVADSIPDEEYNETVNKAAGLGRAIDLAETAFPAEKLMEDNVLEKKSNLGSESRKPSDYFWKVPS